MDQLEALIKEVLKDIMKAIENKIRRLLILINPYHQNFNGIHLVI